MARPSGPSPLLLPLFGVLLTAAPAAAEAFAGYGWGFSDNEDGPSLVLGSTETTEDFVFLPSCSNADKSGEMTVYVDIEGAKIGQPVTSELTRDGAEAKGFPAKPVIAVLDGKGPVNVVTG